MLPTCGPNREEGSVTAQTERMLVPHIPLQDEKSEGSKREIQKGSKREITLEDVGAKSGT